MCAVLILLTGAFLAPLFEPLPEATLGAIVIVAVAGFWRLDELRRFARIRRSAIVLAVLALAGVLTLGILQGLLVTAALSLIVVIRKLSRPEVARLARDPETGGWGRTENHPEWTLPPDVVVVRLSGPLFYTNAVVVKEQLLAIAHAEPAPPARLVLDLSTSQELDLQACDSLGELSNELARDGTELRLADVSRRALGVLRAAGLEVPASVTIDSSLEPPRSPPQDPDTPASAPPPPRSA